MGEGKLALHDGFEALGFELLLGCGGGLRVGVGADLDAVILIDAGGENEDGKFSLLERLSHGQGVAFFFYRGDLEDDGVFRDERRADDYFGIGGFRACGGCGG